MFGTVASQLEGPGFEPLLSPVVSVMSLDVSPVLVWVSAGCSGLLPPSGTSVLGLILLSVPLLTAPRV